MFDFGFKNKDPLTEDFFNRLPDSITNRCMLRLDIEHLYFQVTSRYYLDSATVSGDSMVKLDTTKRYTTTVALFSGAVIIL